MNLILIGFSIVVIGCLLLPWLIIGIHKYGHQLMLNYAYFIESTLDKIESKFKRKDE